MQYYGYYYELHNLNSDMENELFTKEFCLKGYQLAIGNAKSLHRIAYISSGLAEFGIATSLNILSAEEAAKALILVIRAFFPKGDFSGFNEIFSKHDTKYKFLQSFSKALPIIIFYTSPPEKTLRYFFELLKKNIPKSNGNERIKYETNMKTLEKILNKYFIPNPKMKKPYKNENFEALLEWWEKSNKKKNSGLYVGIKNGQWNYPQNFTQNEFELSSDMTHKIIAHTIRIKKILVQNPKLSTEASK